MLSVDSHSEIKHDDTVQYLWYVKANGEMKNTQKRTNLTLSSA